MYACYKLLLLLLLVLHTQHTNTLCILYKYKPLKMDVEEEHTVGQHAAIVNFGVSGGGGTSSVLYTL